MHSPNQEEKGARRMRYLSVCSGIEAATVAWRPLGWHAHAFAEIEKFPSAVLAHHYPEVPNLGDITRFAEWPDAAFDVLVGGTPCQSFSVAGLRAGLADPRGNLALTYLAIADRYRPEWLVWENVHGVLSSGRGRDFGTFLGALGQLGYGWAYRSLDAQYFGLAQRRERVFVVGHLGDWRRAAAVLFEPSSLRGDPAPGRGAGEGVTAGILRSTDGGSDLDHARAGHLVAFGGNNTQGPIDVATAVRAHGGSGHMDFESETFVVFDCKASGGHGFASSSETAPTLRSMSASEGGRANGGGQVAVADRWGVRRLTPLEWERLQGFPDHYTLVPHRGKPAADSPRYKAIGNSMAVPVVRWIGSRIV